MLLGAQRRWRLSEALSAAELATRASVYAPLAPPGPDALPHLRWQPGNAFHASALLAAVADAVTLPYRLAPGAPPGPLGPPLGACDLHSLVQLLARGTPARPSCSGPPPLASIQTFVFHATPSARQAITSFRVADPSVFCCGRSPARAAASWASPPHCRARRCRAATRRPRRLTSARARPRRRRRWPAGRPCQTGWPRTAAPPSRPRPRSRRSRELSPSGLRGSWEVGTLTSPYLAT
jgi:hypothetical protein